MDAEPLSETAIFRTTKSAKRFIERKGRDDHKGNTGAYLRHIVQRERRKDAIRRQTVKMAADSGAIG